ncbi:DUF1360 domain-containing protein [Heliorestis acidaminivorans]|uniref:DUF1360 domain-containing protein n=1 Tax=Heliorestis acidaminivorans TaxID=553427 RepID=A0A6I0ER08_9FIRM|nr:DUF1360 domain-containing protein [Heliorestis acidaminivorans]KAB2951867.1 DUF1360 domain-containing protein [Heliorestis acidaminivorans]
MFIELLFALSLRFFFFDFILFKKTREKLKKQNYFFKKLLSCSFCQGFWCGIFVYLLFNISFALFTLYNLLNLLAFGFASAILSITWVVIVHPFLKEYEEDQELPLI